MNGCKFCPAYEKCSVTYRGSSCAAIRYYYGLENDPEIVTNGDKIRAMSDEELSEYLSALFVDTREGVCYSTDEDRWLEWLQEPAEEKK